MYTNKYKIINLLIKENKELFLREIHRNTKIPLKTIQNNIKILENENIILSNIVGKNKFFRLNKTNPKIIFEIEIAENKKTIDFIDKNPLLKTFIEKINEDKNSITVVFGSFSNYTNDQNSDIDILTISEKKILLPDHLSTQNIHQIDMTFNEFEKNIEKKSALINEIFKNHIVLNNSSQFTKYILRWTK
ncbi:helix-turn-helix transcriptional regulator [archaeon]|jgi:predicted nucleotidyltransferase|nr:helix-turn-helix transcriptional regulator [archaeon]MBT4351519.1 helix-turn-helix transcriptional regulator [archaeon]MBT4648640.1 helix-turn-helix transcriptional regulator [archaeon]MBT6822505.1 helix-turn-helix transcriptional regulator [archaeon]MBT7392179.1 helix-turn-helix transcriptional regulator [archaeon]